MQKWREKDGKKYYNKKTILYGYLGIFCDVLLHFSSKK